MSDDETFIANESDVTCDVGTAVETNDAAEEATVADLDDAPVPNDRSRRTNAGKGLGRLQMDFQGKGYQSKREHNFITNSASTEGKGEASNSVESYTKLACDVIFTRMTAKRDFKQCSSKAVAIMIKEFTQLNE